MSRICVDRCVCFHRRFDELLAIARRTGATTLDDLQEETEFGLACRICNPYIRRMLRTGQTTFDQILTEADEPPERRVAAKDVSGGDDEPGAS